MDQFDSPILDSELSGTPVIARRKLLPVWIKIFIWIFMITGGLAVLGLPFGMLGLNFNIALYGIETVQPLTPAGLMLIAIYLIKGIVAYALWTEKDWAVTAAQVDATIGIIICAFIMVIYPMMADSGSSFNFRLEIIVLVLYLMKMNQIKEAWEKPRNI